MPENLKVVFAGEETDRDEPIMRRTNDEPDRELKQLIDLKPDSREMGGLGKDEELPSRARGAVNPRTNVHGYVIVARQNRNAASEETDRDARVLFTCGTPREESEFLDKLISCSDQQKEDNQHEAKTGHLSTTSGKMNIHLGFNAVGILDDNLNVRESSGMFPDPYPPHYENERFLRPSEHSMQEKVTDQAFPGHDDDDDASCRLAGMMVLLVASLLRLNVGHLSLSTSPLFIQLMRVFIWSGIVSGISVVLLWLLRLPRQSILLLIAILSTIGSYACAIAVFLPFESLRAPFWLLLSPGSVSTCLCS